MGKKLTVGMILTIIAAIGLFIWVTSAVTRVASNPTDPTVVAKVTEESAQKITDESIPTLFSVILGIVGLFGGGLFAAILIMGAVFGWDKIENFNVLPFIEDIADYFSDSRASL